ncbi:hypothetical protein [Acinetobacter proteolyticus]|uniref:SWIM-type domain-containing protein n=1 Tax=Acinetobacter proteolyticus TaxID=1776741 RepID=A0A2N0WIE0_9GAMM|nr:hypothetical protein [Acinetobacter proteolyticus]PKF35569.1 hypothetical protein CW311_04580 [Acinetobacter proteolyticus]
MVDSAHKISGSLGEAKARAKANQEKRESAPNILNPHEVRGEYDANRMLETTLGGIKRIMTAEDLAQFRRNAAIAGKNFVGGITARQVIDHSLAEDRKRARQQILWATPAYSMKNQKGTLTVHFNTDASKQNGKSRHFVQIELQEYQTAIASGAHSAQKAARIMTKGKLKFDCSCGKHVYFLRYVATVGNYNAGRAETGYPKIRNPNLVGIACKHVLRVMAELEGGAYTLAFLTRAIDQGRKSADGSVRTQAKQKDANEHIKKQSGRSTGRLDSREERDLHRSRLALRKSAAAHRVNMPKPKVMAGGSRKLGQLGKLANNKTTETILLQTIQGLGLSREQALALLQNK